MPDFQENPPHPLFPPNDDDDEEAPAPLISEILIMRAEQGKKITCPRMFRGEELLSLNDLAAQYGGGEYELIGRHNNRITARRRYTIPGPNKPMYDAGIPEPSPVTQSVSPVSQNPMGGDGGGIMGMLVTMMQMMMQSQAQAAQQNTQLMIAMMTAGRESSAEDRAAARAEMAANVERERIASERNITMMREMMALQQRPSGGAGEDFTRGVEFMRSFATQQIDTLRATAKEGGDTDWGSILETLGQVMQGVGMLKGIGGSPAEAIPQATELVS